IALSRMQWQPAPNLAGCFALRHPGRQLRGSRVGHHRRSRSVVPRYFEEHLNPHAPSPPAKRPGATTPVEAHVVVSVRTRLSSSITPCMVIKSSTAFATLSASLRRRSGLPMEIVTVTAPVTDPGRSLSHAWYLGLL